ncbi:MAG: prolipoprotein diacylglyceryl transferase [Verrucomicrobiota bacterium]
MQVPLAYYVHDLNPIIFQVTDSIALRWYGLSYVAAFFVGWWILRMLIRWDYFALPEEKLTDFVTYAALFGVLLGGRLGYMLLYDTENFLKNPLMFFQFTKGGMASHGGIAGLAIFLLVYARLHKMSWTALGDNLVVTAPLGIFFGRMANFINGELYGRKAEVPWAVQFPTELRENNLDPDVHREILFRSTEGIDTSGMDNSQVIETVIAASRDEGPVREIMAELLSPRHPSQVYQGLMEGLSLFLILLVVRLLWKRAPNGFLTGIFFGGYAIFRILGERFREAESGFGPGIFDFLTKGQFYSLFMIIAAAGFFLWAGIARKTDSKS